MISTSEYIKLMNETWEKMTQEERDAWMESLKDVEVPSDQEILEDIWFTQFQRECIAGTLERMDNMEWAELFKKHNKRNGDVSLWEIVDGDIELANDIISENEILGFLN